jgi:hypothetical protein
LQGPARDLTDESGVWVLAAPDAPDASLVVMAVRPYAIRFTATELNRLGAVLDCRRRLTWAAELRWRDEPVSVQPPYLSHPALG